MRLVVTDNDYRELVGKSFYPEGTFESAEVETADSGVTLTLVVWQMRRFQGKGNHVSFAFALASDSIGILGDPVPRPDLDSTIFRRWFDAEVSRLRKEGLQRRRTRIEIVHNDECDRMTLARLKTIPLLESLCLVGFSFADEEYMHISANTELSHLRLERSTMEQIGFGRLKSLEKLTSLSIMGSNAGDSFVDDLIAINQLTVLDIRHTKVTADGARRLQDALPKCEVHY
jgi:hypothetical protein